MQYNLFCLATYKNYIWLKLTWYDPEESKYQWHYYIASFLEQEWAQFAIANLQWHVEWLKVTEERLTAKQMDYQYTVRNIQYRLGRFTNRALDLISNKILYEHTRILKINSRTNKRMNQMNLIQSILTN